MIKAILAWAAFHAPERSYLVKMKGLADGADLRKPNADSILPEQRRNTMVISARVHYACVAMLELAIQNDEGSPVAIREITDRHGIAGPFLVQILRSLRALGWVQSIRGSQGGYRLSVDPATITLLDIAEAIGSQEAGCRTEATCTPMAVMLQTQWDDAAEASRRVLGQATLSGLVERAQHGDASMFYI